MPTLLDPIDYDKFDYKDCEESALSLEEAIKRVRRLRESDAGQFHRIVPVHGGAFAFRVKSVTPQKVYAERTTQLASFWAKILSHL